MELKYRNVEEDLESQVRAELERPSPVRIWAIAKAFELGMNVAEVHTLTSIDLCSCRRWTTSTF